jgi:hypothetical protein
MISLAIMAAKAFAPSIIGSLLGDKAESVAGDVLDIAKSLTGVSDPDVAVDMLGKNPELALQFKQSVMDYQLAMAREDTDRLKAVNATMVAESKSEHWMQYSWRPFNGFLFGITLFMNYVFPNIANMFIDTQTNYFVAQTIPSEVLMSWAAVLGVTAWHRGVQKRVESAENVLTPADRIKSLANKVLGNSVSK